MRVVPLWRLIKVEHVSLQLVYHVTSVTSNLRRTLVRVCVREDLACVPLVLRGSATLPLQPGRPHFSSLRISRTREDGARISCPSLTVLFGTLELKILPRHTMTLTAPPRSAFFLIGFEHDRLEWNSHYQQNPSHVFLSSSQVSSCSTPSLASSPPTLSKTPCRVILSRLLNHASPLTWEPLHVISRCCHTASFSHR